MKAKRKWPTVKIGGEDFVCLAPIMAVGIAVLLYYDLFTRSPKAIDSLASFFGGSIMITIVSFIVLMSGSAQNGSFRASKIKLTERHMRPFLTVVGSCIALSIIFGIMGW